MAASPENMADTASAVPALVYSDVSKLCPLVSSAGALVGWLCGGNCLDDGRN